MEYGLGECVCGDGVVELGDGNGGVVSCGGDGGDQGGGAGGDPAEADAG